MAARSPLNRPGENSTVFDGFAAEPTSNGGTLTEAPELALELAADDWAIPFLAAYTGQVEVAPDASGSTRATMNKSRAARHAGVHPRTIGKRLERDPVFADLMEQAENVLDDAAEQVLYERVTEGTRRPIFLHGEVVGEVREVDNRLLQFYLERRRPQRWHITTRVEHVSPDTPGAFTFRLGDKPLELETGD